MFSSLALHIKSVRVVRNKAFKIVTIGYNQFGCGISKMVGPKKQGFCPKINMLKGNFDTNYFEPLMIFSS